MLEAIHRFISRARPRRIRFAHGPEGIAEAGHRDYVGGLWDEIGRLQFDFLVSQGLRPDHVLLDIACGSLRAGVHLIPYLEPGHYLGIDKEEELIRAGVERELDPAVREEKRPEFVVSAAFEFDRFTARPDYAIAQSLFTHLPEPLVRLCFARLRDVIQPDGVLFATYFESSRRKRNPRTPHDHAIFRYTRHAMTAFGGRRWTAEYIGGWGHPRGQVMVRYRPA